MLVTFKKEYEFLSDLWRQRESDCLAQSDKNMLFYAVLLLPLHHDQNRYGEYDRPCRAVALSEEILM